MASVSWASVEIDPSDIAPVAKRLTISWAGSTSSSGTGSRSLRKVSRPRSVARRAASELTMLGVLVVLLLRAAVQPPDRVLEQRDRLGVPHVVLAVAPPGVDAADGQQVLVRARPRARVAVERLAREHAEPDAADARGGAR